MNFLNPQIQVVRQDQQATLSNSNVYQHATEFVFVEEQKLSKDVTQSEEKIKQLLIDSLKDIDWDITLGKTDAVMTKLEEAQRLTREWKARKT